MVTGKDVVPRLREGLERKPYTSLTAWNSDWSCVRLKGHSTTTFLNKHRPTIYNVTLVPEWRAPAWPSVRRSAGKQKDIGSIPLRLSFLFERCYLCTLCREHLMKHYYFYFFIFFNQKKSSLPFLMQNHSDGHSVAICIVSLFTHILGSRS